MYKNVISYEGNNLEVDIFLVGGTYSVEVFNTDTLETIEDFKSDMTLSSIVEGLNKVYGLEIVC